MNDWKLRIISHRCVGSSINIRNLQCSIISSQYIDLMVSECHFCSWCFCDDAIVVYKVWIFTCCWSMSIANCFGLASLFICWIVSFSLVMRQFRYQTMFCKKYSFSILVKSHFGIKLIPIELVEIIFVLINVIHALVRCKCILLFYFWIFIYCLNFLYYKLLDFLFFFCLCCIKSVSRLLALIILWIFSLLKIFKIYRHRLNIIFIFWVRKSMNLLIKLLLIKFFLFFCLQLISLIILYNIFLWFQVFKLIWASLLRTLNILWHVLPNTLKVFVMLFLSLTIL